MSSVMKMSIQGIRSFGPEDKDKGIIEFFSPLTLILGPNGTGKTTIIECLKYMTTGEMPPGAKTGGAFIHDPKIAHEREVKAQIRLQFRDVKGEICVAQRSLVATQQAKNITMKTLDGVITRKLKDGSKASISKRCADMDREIVALLGVSKPVLENVIFCHQEDSNWPLSEGKALKQKFDDIFASTRYVKALETIRKLRLEHSSTIKVYSGEMKYLKQNKDKAAEIKRDLEDRESRYVASRENVEKISDKLKPIENELLRIQRKANEIYKLNTNIEKLKSEKAQMVKHTEELKKHIANPFEGNTDELEDTISKFEAKVKEKEYTLQQLANNVHSLDRKIEKVNNKKSELLLTQGKLEQEAERHKENVKKRDNKIRQIAEKLDFVGFSSNIDDTKVNQLLDSLDKLVKKSLMEAKERREEYEVQEARYQKEAEKLRSKKTSLETQQKMKTEQMKKNKEEIRGINQELSRVAASGEKLKDIELDLKRAESRLSQAEKSVDLEKLRSEISQLQQSKGKLDGDMKQLDSEMSRISRESSIRSELDLFKKDKTGKEDEVRRLKSRNEDSVKHLLGNFPEENLSRKLDTYINQQSREVRQAQTKLQQLQSELARLEADRRNCQEHLRKKESELRDYEEKIEDVCHSQSLEESLARVEADLKAEQDRRGGLTGMTYLYNRYMENLGKKSECPLCETHFDNDAVERLRAQLEKKLALVPERIEKCDRKLKETKMKHEKIIELRPVKVAARDLHDDQIPNLKTKLRKVSDEIDKTTQDISEHEDTVETKQVDESTAKSMQADATMIDAHRREIRELTRKIQAHASKISGGDSQRTLQQVQNEREELLVELEGVNRSLDRKREKQSEQSEYIQQVKGEVNELRAGKLQIESDLQQRVRLEEQKDQLENVNAVLLVEIDDAKGDVEPLKSRLEEFEREREEVVRAREKQWEKDKDTAGGYRADKSDVESRNEEVKKYLDEGKDRQLEESHQHMVKIEETAEILVCQKQDLGQQCTDLNKELQDQKGHQRELEDNLNLRRKEQEIEKVVDKIKKTKEELGDLDVTNLEKERQTLMERQENMLKEKHQLEGRKQCLEDEMRKLKRELRDDMFKDADQKYRDKMIALRTTELATQDLDKYYRALDRAIMSYHSNKMAEINKIIRELWRNTYKGNDIETIEIRSDQDDKASTGCDKRRSYNYRVVMIKGDAAIDMRGRCSAGQKVLASIIIRLALAETFCLNCGILALDEPTTNLDRENIESLAYALDGIIKSRSKQANFQLVVITHDEDFVELLGRSDYVEEFFKVRKDQFACSQLVKAKVQDLHTR